MGEISDCLLVTKHTVDGRNPVPEKLVVVFESEILQLLVAQTSTFLFDLGH